MEQLSIKKVNEKVDVLKKVVLEMQEFLEDSFLTAKEEKILDETLKEHEEGKVFSLEDVERARNAKN